MATPYVTPALLRSSTPALADPSRYPDATLADLVTQFEEIAEDYLGAAYTPRTAVEHHHLSGTTPSLTLHHVQVRSITSVVIDGATMAAGTYQVTSWGSALSLNGFAPAAAFPNGDAVVTIEHGHDSPTRGLVAACREWVRIEAIADRSAAPRDIIRTSADGMTTQYGTPNKALRRPTGYLRVDALLNALPDERVGLA